MGKFQDLTGQHFGKLKVIERTESHISPSGYKYNMWRCQCDCGNFINVRTTDLKNNHTQSCGCLHKEMLSKAKLIDLTGQVYERLTVIKRVDDYISPSGSRKVQWLCKCECGKEVIATGNNLKNGNSKSCGCYNRELLLKMNLTHNASNTRLYHIWTCMKDRCYNPKNKKYKDYGGRGIIICDEWINDFEAFANWAYDNGYVENVSRGECTIDRIDVNGNYCQQNCRWVNQKVQTNNKRNNHYITYNGETHTVTEWNNILGYKKGVLSRRIFSGWSIEDAFTKPVKSNSKKGDVVNE